MQFFDAEQKRHSNEYVDVVFVFGSNLAGRHGRGAALYARDIYGAKNGVGRGRTGQAYAIPTKDAELNVLPLVHIAREIAEFIEYAKAHPDEHFFVTKVGTGLAGYSNQDIAPLFRGVPENCIIDKAWKDYISL